MRPKSFRLKSLSVVIQEAGSWESRHNLDPSAATGPSAWALTARGQCQSIGVGMFGGPLVLVALRSAMASDCSLLRSGVLIFFGSASWRRKAFGLDFVWRFFT